MTSSDRREQIVLLFYKISNNLRIPHQWRQQILNYSNWYKIINGNFYSICPKPKCTRKGFIWEPIFWNKNNYLKSNTQQIFEETLMSEIIFKIVRRKTPSPVGCLKFSSSDKFDSTLLYRWFYSQAMKIHAVGMLN